MISLLKGILDSKTDSSCVVDVNGVGYEVIMPASDLDRLPPLGEPVTLFTRHLIRDDQAQLFGFLTSEDRALFKTLLGVAGVGPKSALAVLSGLTPGQLEQAVGQQDAQILSRLPGIGRKTAERLILELKDKLQITPQAAHLGAVERESFGEALEALQALGYSANQARTALQRAGELPGHAAGGDRTAEWVRRALKHL